MVQAITRSRRIYAELTDRLKDVLFGVGIAPDQVELERSEFVQNRVTFDLYINNQLAAQGKTTDQLAEMINGAVLYQACGLSTKRLDDSFMALPFSEEEQAEIERQPEPEPTPAPAPAPVAAKPRARNAAGVKRNAAAKKGGSKIRRRYNAPAPQAQAPQAPPPVQAQPEMRHAASQGASGAGRGRRTREAFMPDVMKAQDERGVPSFIRNSFRSR